jgi:hypothetical protein
MPTKLKKLVVDELSLVDKGANRYAKVSIMKRAEPDVGGISKTEGLFEVDVAPTSQSSQPLDSFDALVQKRMHELGEDEPIATVKISQTAEGQRLYREAMLTHDVEVAKSTTLLTFGNRAVEKIGGHSVAERTAVTDALEKLDAMAKAEASKTGQTYYQAYARILSTPAGRALYSAACAKPSLASGAAA